VRSRPPPSVQPASRPGPSGPSAGRSLSSYRHRGKQVRSEGPDGSGVNGLMRGPCGSSAGLSPGRPGACRE
jgi:hypothetical protein